MKKGKISKGRVARLGSSRVAEVPNIMPDLEGHENNNEELGLSDVDEWDSVDEWGFNT